MRRTIAHLEATAGTVSVYDDDTLTRDLFLNAAGQFGVHDIIFVNLHARHPGSRMSGLHGLDIVRDILRSRDRRPIVIYSAICGPNDRLIMKDPRYQKIRDDPRIRFFYLSYGPSFSAAFRELAEKIRSERR